MMKCAVIVFIKYPEPGKVKTRLGKHLGYETAAKLYTAFVEDMLFNFDKSGLNPIIAFDPFQPIKKYQKWLGDRIYIAQQGEDLGQRMYNVLQAAFDLNYDACILTGSDLPDLEPELIHQAQKELKKAPACIGPASDGGYYLIGFQKDHLTDSIFKEMEWSTDRVLPETLSRLKSLGINPVILPEHQDMDTLEDLERLRKNPKAKTICPKSLAFLRILLPH